MTTRTLLSSHGSPISTASPALTLPDSQNTRRTHYLPRHSRISPKRSVLLARTFKSPTCTCKTTRLHSTGRSAPLSLASILLYLIPCTPLTIPSPVLPSALPYNLQNTRAHLLFHPSGSPPNSAFPTLLVSTRLTLMCFRGSYANRSLESYTRPTTVPKQPPPVYC